MELGIKRQKGFPDEVFNVSFEISGRTFTENVSRMLRFEKNPLDLTDVELNQALDYCSYYRGMFLIAYSEVRQKRETEESDFEIWFNEKLSLAGNDIRNERIKEVESKQRSQIGQITEKQELSKVFLNADWKESYILKKVIISDLKKNESILRGLMDILQDRGIHLCGIARRRWEEKHQPEFLGKTSEAS